MSDRGLGGGIAYAWDPELCERLDPLFREVVKELGGLGLTELVGLCEGIDATSDARFCAGESLLPFVLTGNRDFIAHKRLDLLLPLLLECLRVAPLVICGGLRG